MADMPTLADVVLEVMAGIMRLAAEDNDEEAAEKVAFLTGYLSRKGAMTRLLLAIRDNEFEGIALPKTDGSERPNT
jgi:hypothetical protein